MSRSRRTLCVCGLSQELPFCDGRHEEEGWSCAVEAEEAGLAFGASPRLRNLAHKLASHFDAARTSPSEGPEAVDRLVLIVDGHDLAVPRAIHERVEARAVRVFSLGLEPGLLAGVFPGARVCAVDLDSPLEAFARIREMLEGEEPTGPATPPVHLRRAFVSHAVADEARILPVSEYLRRHFSAELFLCADSIPGGEDWRTRIDGALWESELFLLLLSEATARSHFCSYEIGVATGLEKPVQVISLDGTRPPAFLQHVQTADLPRLASARSWLETEDLLLEEMLRALGGA